MIIMRMIDDFMAAMGITKGRLPAEAAGIEFLADMAMAATAVSTGKKRAANAGISCQGDDHGTSVFRRTTKFPGTSGH
jgi:hypothetical protein